MYAVIKTGGKQYKVSANDIILVEKIEAEPGSTVNLDQVLMVGDGANVGIGKDHTLFAKADGRVSFHTGTGGRTTISVKPEAAARPAAE